MSLLLAVLTLWASPTPAGRMPADPVAPAHGSALTTASLPQGSASPSVAASEPDHPCPPPPLDVDAERESLGEKAEDDEPTEDPGVEPSRHVVEPPLRGSLRPRRVATAVGFGPSARSLILRC